MFGDKTGGNPEDERCKVKVLPPIVLLACVAGGIGMELSGTFNLKIFDQPSTSISSALGIIGAIGTGIGVRMLQLARQAFETDKNPTRHGYRTNKLCQAGIFQHTRNPMYVGLVLITTSLGIAVNTYSGFLCVLPFITYLHFHVIPKEESYLNTLFPSEFPSYCKKVPRWVLIL